MFTHSAVPMVIVSIDSRILAANELFTTMVCMTQEEACERSVLSITHPEDVGRAFGCARAHAPAERLRCG